MSLSLQRNAHLYKPNLAKFSRENLAKFAFREGFGHFSLDQFDRRFLLSFQSRRFSLEMFFCWGRACRFTHRHCQHFTCKRRSLLFEPTPPLRVYTVATTPDLWSVATCNVRTTRNVNIPPPHPTPPHHDLRTHANKNVRFTSMVFSPLA